MWLMFYKVHFPRKISILTRQKVEIGNKKLEHGHQTSRSLHIPYSFFQRIDVMNKPLQGYDFSTLQCNSDRNQAWQKAKQK